MRRSARWPLENDLHQRGLDPACAQVSPHRGRGTTAAAADVGAGGPGRRGASRGRDSAGDCVEPPRRPAAVERADGCARRPVPVRAVASPCTAPSRAGARDQSYDDGAASVGLGPGPHRLAIKAYLYDPTGATARAVKARYRGYCRSAALTPGRATARATRHARVPRRSQRVRGRCQTRSARSRDLRLDRRHSR